MDTFFQLILNGARDSLLSSKLLLVCKYFLKVEIGYCIKGIWLPTVDLDKPRCFY